MPLAFAARPICFVPSRLSIPSLLAWLPLLSAPRAPSIALGSQVRLLTLASLVLNLPFLLTAPAA